MRTILRAVVFGAIIAAGVPAAAKLPPVSVTAQQPIAVSGYDPVAYFKAHKPVMGSSRFTASHDGATWYFASAANRDAFTADPAAYAPQYGGYCALAVSEGVTATADPTKWKIVGGKLYLNHNQRAQTLWETDIPGKIKVADTNWPTVLDQ